MHVYSGGYKGVCILIWALYSACIKKTGIPNTEGASAEIKIVVLFSRIYFLSDAYTHRADNHLMKKLLFELCKYDNNEF